MESIIAIYQEAIEPSEQKSPEQLVKALGDQRYLFLAARVAGATVGFSISFFPAAGDFWVLEYMAVHKAARSQGYGEQIFIATRRAAQARCGDAPCLLEVDQPLSHLETGDQATRRLQFYARIGCRRIVGLDYVLPLDGSCPPPMWLLIHGLGEHASLSAVDLERWLTTIYVDVYNQKNEDPRLAKMLSAGGGAEKFALAKIF